MLLYKLYNNLLHVPNKIIHPLSPEIMADNEFKKKGYKIHKTEDSHKYFLSNLLKNIHKDIDLDVLKHRIMNKNAKNFNYNIFDLIRSDDKNKLEKYYSSKSQIDMASSLL